MTLPSLIMINDLKFRGILQVGLSNKLTDLYACGVKPFLYNRFRFFVDRPTKYLSKSPQLDYKEEIFTMRIFVTVRERS